MQCSRTGASAVPLPRAAIIWGIGPALGATILWAGGLSGQGFQWPDEPENLEVLPQDIGSAGLRSTMFGFVEALDVRCQHCHVGEGDDLEDFDFAADDKETKEIARVMLRMVRAINETHLAELADHGRPRADRVEVTCLTCHRGAVRPRRIEDVLAETIEEEGVDAAAALYRDLRRELYGGFTYDFRPGPLAELGRRLAAAGRTDAALRMVGLEAEYDPDSYTTWFALGRIQAQAGAREEAIASLERALALAPERAKGFVQRELDRTRAGG